MDAALRAEADAIVSNLPLSIEKPAGTGKTELVAAIAAVAAERGERVLILTHTHAGVDAIRKRLRTFDVDRRAVHVDTITGWAFDLVRAYPVIAGVEVPEDPDWTQSAAYIAGATLVARSDAIATMHAHSFGFLIVDEYQDCVIEHHGFIAAIADAIPAACVLGDRLQGIFGFAGRLVDWDTDVAPRFPPRAQVHLAHRWAGHNPELGEWLLQLRGPLIHNEAVDLSAVRVDGFRWARSDPAEIVRSAFESRPDTESVLVLGQWRADANEWARLLNGMYGVMEDVQGVSMLEFLQRIDNGHPDSWAGSLAEFAKSCFAGLSSIDQPVLAAVAAGRRSSRLSRPGLEPALQALDDLRAAPTHEQLSASMGSIGTVPSIRLFKAEAWLDVRKAIDRSIVSGTTTVAALARVRDSVRHEGRRPAKRVVSRTVLVKGLEYDHVIIADAAALGSSRNLYVALTRARKSLTVFSGSPIVRFAS